MLLAFALSLSKPPMPDDSIFGFCGRTHTMSHHAHDTLLQRVLICNENVFQQIIEIIAMLFECHLFQIFVSFWIRFRGKNRFFQMKINNSIEID